jgi:hypothetical protein
MRSRWLIDLTTEGVALSKSRTEFPAKIGPRMIHSGKISNGGWRRPRKTVNDSSMTGALRVGRQGGDAFD